MLAGVNVNVFFVHVFKVVELVPTSVVTAVLGEPPLPKFCDICTFMLGVPVDDLHQKLIVHCVEANVSTPSTRCAM